MYTAIRLGSLSGWTNVIRMYFERSFFQISPWPSGQTGDICWEIVRTTGGRSNGVCIPTTQPHRCMSANTQLIDCLVAPRSSVPNLWAIPFYSISDPPIVWLYVTSLTLFKESSINLTNKGTLPCNVGRSYLIWRITSCSHPICFAVFGFQLSCLRPFRSCSNVT